MGSKASSADFGGLSPKEAVERDVVRELVNELAATGAGRGVMNSIAARARLADLGKKSSTIAHELRQPLFTIAMANENLRLLLRGEIGTNRARMELAIARIAEQVQRAEAIIESTLAYAAHSAKERSDLAEAANNGVRFLAELLSARGIVVERCVFASRMPVRVSRVELEQVFVNLLRNAIDSIGERRKGGWQGEGHILVQLGAEEAEGWCRVSDNGAGLSREVSEAAFTPFFTTKLHDGTGLGLHICRQILAKGEGTIHLVPRREQGAMVEIRLPLLSDEEPSGVVAA